MDRQRLSPSVPTNHVQQQMPGFMPPQQGFHLPPPSFMSNQFPCIRVEVKLVDSKSYPDCNTDLSVVTIVKKPADTDFKTVAEFGRSLLTDCAPDWILKLARRHSLMRKRTKSSVFLCFGGGYDLLVLLEGAEVPKDISKVPRISVSTAISTKSEESRLGKENLPIASYSDGVWDHVSAMATTFRGHPMSAEMVAVLSDSVAPFGAIEGISDRVKVIRIWTQTKSIDEATRFDHTQNLDLSKMTMASAEPPSVSKTKADTPPPTQTTEVKKPAASTTQTATSASSPKPTVPAPEVPKKRSIPSQTKKAPVSSPAKKTPISSPAKKTPVPSPTKAATAAKPAPSTAAKNDVVQKSAPKAPVTSTEQKDEAAAETKKRGRPKGSKTTKAGEKTASEGGAVAGEGPSPKKPKTASVAPPKQVDKEKSKAAAPKKTVEPKPESTAAKTELTDATMKPNAKVDPPVVESPRKKKKSRPNKLSGSEPPSGTGDLQKEDDKKKKARSKATKKDEKE